MTRHTGNSIDDRFESLSTAETPLFNQKGLTFKSEGNKENIEGEGNKIPKKRYSEPPTLKLAQDEEENAL